MAENACLAQAHACRVRLADLDTDGVPLPGSDNVYVSNALVIMSVSPNYTDGDEIEEKNGCGEVQVSLKGDPTLKWFDVTLRFTTPDPYLAAMLSQGSVLSGFDGARVGFAAPRLGVISGNGVSIELWEWRINAGDKDSDSPYAWWAYPKVKNLKLNPYEHSAGALLPEYVGQAFENPNWFDGPLNDWPSTSSSAFQWVPTNTIPEAVCGPQALVAS